MTPQVKDLNEFLALAAPPPTQSYSTTASASVSTVSAASFFDDISHLDSSDFTSNNDPANSSSSSSPTTPQNAIATTAATTLTPMQLVALSNLKLNNDMFSNRSLSIHRRILVKNFLTLLYQLNPPMDWSQMQMPQIDYGGDDFGSDTPGDDESMLLREDEQSGWMERTLNAAGLSDDKDDDRASSQRCDSQATSNSTPFTSTNPPPSPLVIPSRTTSSAHSTPLLTNADKLSSSSPSSSSSSTRTAATTAPIAASKAISLTTTGTASSAIGSPEADVPLPRPKSTELPQSLHSYLSTVFDVNWSVELPSKEDLLFTSTSSSSSLGSGQSSLSTSSPMAQKRRSISAASGLSSVSNASTYASPSEPTTTSARSSTTSTSSLLSSMSVASSVSSVNSASSNINAAAKDTLKKPTIAGLDDSSVTRVTNASPMTTTITTPLVRKSSLSSNQTRVTNPGGNNAALNNGNNAAPSGGNSRKSSTNGHAKPMLVPGRRSSLLQTGHMPPALSPPSSNGNSNTNANNNNNNSLGRMNSATASTVPQQEQTHSGMPAPTSSPSPSPTSAPLPSLSPPSQFASAFTSPATSPTLHPIKPAFSRRTSSLPAERPKPIQRTPSSESNLSISSAPQPAVTGSAAGTLALSPTPTSTTLSVPQASIIGLPRPLLNPTPSSALLSSSPPSPPTLVPSPTTSIGQSPLQMATTPHPYMRSLSDDHLLTRPGIPQGMNNRPMDSGRSPSPSPSIFAAVPISEPLAATGSASSRSSTLSRPSPTYLLKASKSSPCLVSGSEGNSQEDVSSSFAAMPDLYAQQQYHQSYQQQQQQQKQQQQHYAMSGQLSGGGSGSVGSSQAPKPLVRTSSRRGMGMSPAAGVAAPSQGAMNISAPLPLIPNNNSYNDYGAYEHHGSPYGGSENGNGRHGYAQSMGHGGGHKASRSQGAGGVVAVVDNKPVGAGRWSSMKMMLGLRVGQSAKG
ncbi:hypothetical protein BC939DRAFT_489082 [Gamsiella multidivaricata]|uniref:uncharacterized protein n=1 Tax=Gamsiella multidivaricata TaxID=101098 RepID=UPI00221FEF3A|nr:uncharacterized protein BC939DRAFT_489082 [Gamsiella multidivaricata]KAG0364537.1 hypothetical protein BGZ54_007404 [Gamsiella multidivaricata]KAI7831758.1 hypothetical protein BC939DRAFT_489082 [Gamsiella multidivaricata]